MSKSKGDSSKKRIIQKEEVNEQFMRKGAKKVTDKEVQDVLINAEGIEDKFKSSGPLRRYIEDARLMLSLLKDYWRGDYRETLWLSISAIVFALLYVWNPLDLIPDFIPFVGLVDDAFALAVAFKLVEKDLKKYKTWKLSQKAVRRSG